ncbi:helix-turn-helix domain-containing protein [Sphingobacterium hotanense]|uniref:helix-turn-helix transcriptional regulator n=1 Tax=Sphingobacterium hotanense TaxID=649196 RepID=UPI0011F1F241|nr:helix-turn-helix transcriptional regulator [Sphingobacterium hotanense]
MADIESDKILRFIKIQKQLNLKQKDFAERVGLTQSKVSLLNNGKAGGNILNDIFYRLHYEFGLSKTWWDTGQGEMFESRSASFQEELTENYIHSESDSVNESYEQLKNKYIKLLEDYNLLLKSKLQ